MRKLLSALPIVSFLAVAGISHAAIGTVDMTWDGCTGPVDKTSAVAGAYELFITVAGHEEPHKAYDVRIIYGNASQMVPDAWRFDADGCETREYIKQEVTSNLCPSFHQDAAGALQIRVVRMAGQFDGYAETLMRVMLANSYPPVNTVDPATRYLLERIRFDLSGAVTGAGSPPETCGGFEQTMYFQLTYATCLDLNGVEIPFQPFEPDAHGYIQCTGTRQGHHLGLDQEPVS